MRRHEIEALKKALKEASMNQLKANRAEPIPPQAPKQNESNSERA
jgi:hypothetical protein